MKILGIDPGIGICGFGLIQGTTLPARLKELFEGLTEIVEMHKPDVISVEKLFFSKNITTGISVAEARGIVLLVAEQHNVPVFEYTPNEIKKTLTGYGSAKKGQVQDMVKLHLNLDTRPKPDDAADALAAAITHSLMMRVNLAE